MDRKLIFVKLFYSPVRLRSERITQKRVARLAPGFVRERHIYVFWTHSLFFKIIARTALKTLSVQDYYKRKYSWKYQVIWTKSVATIVNTSTFLQKYKWPYFLN